MNIKDGLVSLLDNFSNALTYPQVIGVKHHHAANKLDGSKKMAAHNKIKLTWEKKMVFHCKKK